MAPPKKKSPTAAAKSKTSTQDSTKSNGETNNICKLGKEMIIYEHSFYAFLEKNLPMYLPPPSTVAPPQIPRPKVKKMQPDVNLRTLKLDPREFKKYDLYLLLGLQNRRYEATQAEIRAAYRARSLIYHPDKMQQADVQKKGFVRSEDDLEPHERKDAIFKCISFAHQTLSDAARRELYDFVDPGAVDERIPTDSDLKSNSVGEFVDLFGPIFESNSRFRKGRAEAPAIGDETTSRKEVDAFYSFWGAFESIRRFDFLDEDDAEGAENREHKRYLEKKNKAARQKRKNDDNARLRRLFETAYRLDPRIAKFKEEDRLAKLEKLEKKKTSGVSKPLNAAAQKEAERKAKLAAEAEEKKVVAQQLAEARKVKAQAEKERLALKTHFKKMIVDRLYFVEDPLNVALITSRSTILETFLLRAPDLNGPTFELEERINDNHSGDSIFAWLQFNCDQYAPVGSTVISSSSVCPMASGGASSKHSETIAWSLPEIDLLIKAVKVHPGGVRDRWTTITEWYNKHLLTIPQSSGQTSYPERTQNELLAQSALLKSSGPVGVASEEQADYRAHQKRDPRVDLPEPTISIDAITPNSNESATENIRGLAQEPVKSTPWSPEEQLRLEQGLKEFSLDDPDRWDQIAINVQSRSKKECMMRAKDIASNLKSAKS